MTRKRFIKLLMAKWYDRNQANKIAYLHNDSYVELFEMVRRWNEEEYWN